MFKNEMKDVIQEMLTKEKVFKTKLKLTQAICTLKTKTDNLVNTRMDTLEEASNIVVKELKGRNVTVLKAKTENNIPKTVTSSKDEEIK